MKKLKHHLTNATDHIRMTTAEKDAMRENLMQMMDVQTTPLRQGSAGLQSPYQWMWAPRSFVTLGLAALVIASSGTAYAAEGSLPGAPLYGVKVHVIEPIRIALATTPAQKAEVHADIATTRVAEAQTLAAKGDLTPQTAKEISDNYNEHATAALALAAEVGVGATSTSPQNTSSPGKEPAQNFPIGSPEPRKSSASASATSSVVRAEGTSAAGGAPQGDGPRTEQISSRKSAYPTAAAGAASSTTPERDGEQQSDLFGTLHARLLLQTHILNHLDEQVDDHKNSEATSTAPTTTDAEVQAGDVVVPVAFPHFHHRGSDDANR